MFNKRLKEIMEKRGLSAKMLCASLNERGVKVSLGTVRSWIQGTRRPKDYVQYAVLYVLTATS